MADITIDLAGLLEEITGLEKIPVGNGSGNPATVTINLILDKIPAPDLSNCVTKSEVYTKEEINNKIQGVDNKIQEVNDKIPTKVSLLENDIHYVVDDVVDDVIENGVYAVRANGSLCTYEEADESCIAVALITDNQRIMIEKTENYDATNTTFFWGYNLNGKDVAGITEISTGYGYLPKADGTYQSAPNLSGDYTTWTSKSLSDFNGKANTAAIIKAYTEHSVDMDAKDMCKVLQTFNDGTYGSNQGFTDWYIPACGQLALIYLNKTAINEALTAIGGAAFSGDDYWSSSECDDNGSWYVNFDNGNVSIYSKGGSSGFRVRFVRNLTTKTIKERISELETQTESFITTIPEATIDTLGGVKKITVDTLAEDADITTVVAAYNNLINKLTEAGLITSLLEA